MNKSTFTSQIFQDPEGIDIRLMDQEEVDVLLNEELQSLPVQNITVTFEYNDKWGQYFSWKKGQTTFKTVWPRPVYEHPDQFFREVIANSNVEQSLYASNDPAIKKQYQFNIIGVFEQGNRIHRLTLQSSVYGR